MGRAALPIKHAGSIGHDVRNRTWAVKIELNRKTHNGPRRSSKAEAKADLAKGPDNYIASGVCEILETADSYRWAPEYKEQRSTARFVETEENEQQRCTSCCKKAPCSYKHTQKTCNASR